MPRLNHIHDWEHMGGAAFGIYRCKVCQCFGYRLRERAVSKNWKSGRIIPYKCQICGARAVGHDKVKPKELWRYHVSIKQWRCHRHRGEK